VTIKRSTVFISAGGETKVYGSVQEVPFALRRKLVESTRGIHSATILIADRNGREELVRAMQGLPSRARTRAVAAARKNEPRRLAPAWDWVPAVALALALIIVWFLFS